LWSDSLIEGLAWQGIGRRAPNSTTEYTGPSWSWASYDGVAATGLRGDWKDVAKIEDWHVELRNEGNPFGEVKNAWIRIHGPMAELKPSEVETTDHENTLKEIGRTPYPRLRTQYSKDEEGNLVTLDHRDVSDAGDWREWNMHILLLCGKNSEDKKTEETAEQGNNGAEDDSMPFCYGLVVTQAGGGGDSKMKRVGWTFLEGEEAKKVMEDKECWRSVTLV
jgi:hypothetical protein